MKSVALAIDDRSPHGIAAGIARLITTGDLAPGDRLPTVRELAADLGVSPGDGQPRLAGARVGRAHRQPRARGHLRAGDAARWLPRRYRGLVGATPDGRARPLARHARPGAAARARARARPGLRPRRHRRATSEAGASRSCATCSRETWPSPVEAITVVDGALDAIARALEQLVRFGDRVVLENPGFPPFFDLLERSAPSRSASSSTSEGMRARGVRGRARRAGPPSCCCSRGRRTRPGSR